jgi:hypothetical protein
MRDPKSIVIAVLAAACAFLAGSIVGRVGPAQAQQTGSSYAGGTVSANQRYIAATGSVGSGMSVLWIVDTEARRLVVYGTNSLGKSLELRAARNIEWDLKLDEYNDDSQYKAEDLQRLAQRQSGKVNVPAGKEPKEGGGTPAPEQGGK